MTPIERHERRIREINEEYQQNVAQLQKQAERDLRRICLTGAAVVVIVTVISGVIAWLLQ